MERMNRPMLSALVVALLALAPAGADAAVADDGLAGRGWVWPVSPVQVVEPFEAPPHEYGPGHRGIDLAAEGMLRAPADGTVAFSGAVAGRGVLTIEHAGGLVTTFEPVSTELAAGTAVSRGEVVAEVATGGHAAEGAVHFGVRLDGEYINPMLLLGGVPRAVLLPCC
jgi:murein DD-endopeptidase MepM/ murein hydrolase activator NlpD